jgi:hypothetical protein
MSGIFDQIINYSPPLIVSGTVNYKGTWNASANTPTLIDPPVASTKGDYYVVSTAGTQFSITFGVGDWIISNGTAWEKVDLTDAVSSVFGRTGAVVGVSTDYSAVGLTNTAIGASSPSTGAFTSLSSSSTTTLNGTTIPASKTLVVTTDKLSALAATTSAELAGVISDETGSGALVFATSPSLTTPNLGTPSAIVLTNASGTASININGTVGATTPTTGAFTTLSATGQVNITGGTLSQLQSQAGSVYFEQVNTNTGAGAGVQIFQYNSGAGAGGDASIRQFTGAQNWIFGIDNSDGDKWKVSASDTLGTSDVLAVSSTGLAVTGALSSTGNFIAGTSSGVGGRVEANGGSGQNGLGAYTPTAANSAVAMWNAATSGDNVFVSFFTETSITARGTIDYNRAGNLVRYNTTSDQNLKTNIRPLTNSGLLIDRLQPRIFDWKAEGHNTDNAGFIAQEVFEVFPDAVSKGSDTFSESSDYKQWAMDAGKFMPLVIAELQSLRARVAALESK